MIRFLEASFCALALTASAFVARSEAGEIIHPVSLFAKPTQASLQVGILMKGQEVVVTGKSATAEDGEWLPVTRKGKTGWVDANAVRLTEGDFGYAIPSRPMEGPTPVRARIWFGLGPSWEATSGYSLYGSAYSGNQYAGPAIGFGAETLVGKEYRWPIGFRAFVPWFDEKSQGYAAGRISRFVVLGGLGYQLIPQKLEILAHLGLSYITGESSNFDSKIGFTPGLTIGWQLSSAEPGSLYQAVELGAFRIQNTQMGAGDLTGIGTGLCEALSQASDPSCTPGVSPAAYVFTLLYKIGFQR